MKPQARNRNGLWAAALIYGSLAQVATSIHPFTLNCNQELNRAVCRAAGPLRYRTRQSTVAQIGSEIHSFPGTKSSPKPERIENTKLIKWLKVVSGFA
jgi:hypothetical protein